jgi:tRNA-splicing endonuclease subunit Sen34
MAPSAAQFAVEEPFPISRIADRYLLFSVDIISHCRRKHNICGMLVGTIPNLSQQNVFLGIPVELMPEEARVLVERGAAYIVDDAEVHKKAFQDMSREDRLKWLEELDRKAVNVTRATENAKDRRKDKALKEKGLLREVLEKSEGSVAESTATDSTVRDDASASTESGLGFIMKGSSFSDAASPESSESTSEPSLFDSSPPSPASSVNSSMSKSFTTQKHFVTPTTSYPPLPNPPQDTGSQLPAVPKSYPLFRYLHSLGYYHMPGLRFGCHYNSYPGDPLRYHSHFAATGLDWDDEFELLDVVGGGRLATGTKKAYMIGGEDVDVVRKVEDPRKGAGLTSDEKSGDEARKVRAFSIEWAAL